MGLGRHLAKLISHWFYVEIASIAFERRPGSTRTIINLVQAALSLRNLEIGGVCHSSK